MQPLGQVLTSVAAELKFWREFVATDRFLLGWCGVAPTPELQPEVSIFLRAHMKGGRVLDVGSGACSILRGTVQDSLLDAADPLSALYQLFFDYRGHGIVPPMPIAAEDLQFREVYDVVHISNALDHCQDPKRAVEAMFRAAKPGGWVLVCGFVNEADFQHRTGMHQWNIRIVQGCLRIYPGAGGDAVVDRASTISSTKILSTGKQWLFWAGQKPAR
jgi:SAM-dependent methyltransferase